jgi:glucan phosphoethanolaminetransferase (alkaline phosphatase superfamily)
MRFHIMNSGAGHDQAAPISRRMAAGSFIAFVLLLVAPDAILLYFGYGDAATWYSAGFLPLVLLLFWFAIFGDLLWLGCLLLTPFAMLAPAAVFYIGRYHQMPAPEILASIYASNPREIREYIGEAFWPLLAGTALATGFSFATAWALRRTDIRWRHESRKRVIGVLVAAPLVTAVMLALAGSGSVGTRLRDGLRTASLAIDPIPAGYPFGILQRIVDFRNEWNTMRAEAARLSNFRFHARRIERTGQRHIYVLAIGEASRRDHWQIHGYPRATNPELSRIPGIVPIADMVSAWPESLTAIPMILTRKPPTAAHTMAWHEASVLRAMDEAGFDTWWISNQMPIGHYDSPVSIYAFEARHTVFRNHASWSAPGTYDDDLLQPLREAILGSDRDLFVVIHLMGSHQRYDFRYPAGYTRFHPIELGPDGGMQAWMRTRNSYDNSILYTDHVLAQVIGILRDSGDVTALWYESDHGESLPTATCPLEGHGYGTRYEYEISALFWASDAYARAHPAELAALRTNAKKPTMSSNTFESLIDMTGTSYPGRDRSSSLFDPNWRYRPRMVNYPWKVDFDQAQFGRNCQVVLPGHG